jgi:hypothetical protein
MALALGLWKPEYTEKTTNLSDNIFYLIPVIKILASFGMTTLVTVYLLLKMFLHFSLFCILVSILNS